MAIDTGTPGTGELLKTGNSLVAGHDVLMISTKVKFLDRHWIKGESHDRHDHWLRSYPPCEVLTSDWFIKVHQYAEFQMISENQSYRPHSTTS